MEPGQLADRPRRDDILASLRESALNLIVLFYRAF